MNEAQQKLYDFVPATGEVPYQELYDAVQATADRKVIKEFHAMRRAGLLTVRLDNSVKPTALFVSRPEGA